MEVSIEDSPGNDGSLLLDSLDCRQAPTFPVNGKMLKEAGIKPGPQMGSLIKSIKEAWKASRFTLSAEELITTAVEKK